MDTCISLYDRTGNWSRPYEEAGWRVIRIDIQHGIDILEWDYEAIEQGGGSKVILIAQPCDMYALSGARHFEAKDKDGRTAYHQLLVSKTRKIVKYFNPFAWALEQPKTRIHKLNGWIGQRPKFVFDPCDFAGYDPVPDNSRYNKETWLFGKFNDPISKRMEPIYKENPGWKNLGGKSIETKNARSVTPLGFAYAFYQANH